MSITGLRLDKKCPNCGGMVWGESDGYENYYTCVHCAKQFDLQMKSRSMTPQRLFETAGVGLSKSEIRRIGKSNLSDYQ